MPQCAGCGRKVSSGDPHVTMNKIWHKDCFRCNKCNCDLNADFARVYRGEIYCHSCFKIFRKYCSFEGEDETANVEEHMEPYGSSSQTYCKVTPSNSEECLACKSKKHLWKSNGNALPRELANYFNRNPIDIKHGQVRPCVYPVFQVHSKTRPSCKKHNKRPATCLSRSSSCLDRAARSLSRKRDNTDSCESLEKFKRNCHARTSCGEPKWCHNKMHCDVNNRHKYTGCAPCRRCGHKVYAAEIVLTSYGAYHNSCFSCYSCLKPLDATTVEEHCGEIFCRHCYKNHFGMNSYGFRNRVS